MYIFSDLEWRVEHLAGNYLLTCYPVNNDSDSDKKT